MIKNFFQKIKSRFGFSKPDRIKDVLEFSSFFRKSDCIDDLNILKSSKDELEVLDILKEIK